MAALHKVKPGRHDRLETKLQHRELRISCHIVAHHRGRPRAHHRVGAESAARLLQHTCTMSDSPTYKTLCWASVRITIAQDACVMPISFLILTVHAVFEFVVNDPERQLDMDPGQIPN